MESWKSQKDLDKSNNQGLIQESSSDSDAVDIPQEGDNDTVWGCLLTFPNPRPRVDYNSYRLERLGQDRASAYFKSLAQAKRMERTSQEKS